MGSANERQRYKVTSSLIIGAHTQYDLCNVSIDYGLSQWETTLQSNVVSHWLNPYPTWSLLYIYRLCCILRYLSGRAWDPHHSTSWFCLRSTRLFLGRRWWMDGSPATKWRDVLAYGRVWQRELQQSITHAKIYVAQNTNWTVKRDICAWFML